MRVSEVGPIASGFWRMVLSIIPMILIAQIINQKNFNKPNKIPLKILTIKNLRLDFWLFFAVAFFFAGDLGTWHIALHHTTVANSVIIVNSTVFVVAIVAWIIHKERPSRFLITGAVVGFIGVLILILGSATQVVEIPRATLMGDLLSCVTNLFYASYLLSLRYIRRIYSASSIMVVSNVICALLLLILALIFNEKIIPETFNGWMMMVLLALVCQVAGQTLIAKGLDALPIGFSSMVLLNQVLVSAIASAFILGERITLVQIIGAGLLVVGIYWARPRNT